MFSKRLCCGIFKNKNHFYTSASLNKREHPFWRTIRILKEDLQIKERIFPPGTDQYSPVALSRRFPTHADIVIIGGGAIGSSIAYWLKRKTNRDGIKVVVLEKDKSYTKCTTAISMGGLKQQFFLPENIQLAAYGAEFLRLLKKDFGKEANVNYHPAGYLLLASDEGAQQLIDNVILQREYGAINIPLTPEQIKKRFPYLDLSDIAAGSLGLQKEGWFNAWDFLTLIRNKTSELGAEFINAEAVDFLFEERSDIIMEGAENDSYQSTNQIVVKLPNEEELKTIQFAYCIIAAGHESSNVAQLAKIGVNSGMLSIPLPIEKRKRYVYTFNCENQPPSINTPMIEDYLGFNLRREGLGGSFIVGASPHPDFTPDGDTEEDKKSFFHKTLLPCLARRVPAFENVKVTGMWSGEYDFNIYDGNGIIGPHPYFTNIYLATGFSDQGIQQAPGVGRAVSELILDGGFRTIDLTRLGFDRVIVEKPMFDIRVT